jgi:hypothetical protein
MEDYASVPNYKVAQNSQQVALGRKKCQFNPLPHMYSVFHTVISLFAIYLSFKCNKGVNFPDLFIAMLCPVLYVLYRVAISDDLCGLRK